MKSRTSNVAETVENEGTLLLREVMRMLTEAVKIFRRARLLCVHTDLKRRKTGLGAEGFYAPHLSVRSISAKLCAVRCSRSHAIRGNIASALNAPLLIKLYIRAGAGE